MHKLAILAVLLAASFAAGATNNNQPNECGNHGNNCQPAGNGGSNATATGGNGTGVGVGIGVGVGGQGGQGGSGGGGGDASAIGVGGAGGSVLGSGNSSNLNHNSANGGDAKAYGGSSGAISGSKSVAQMASENSASLKNTNANNSSATGNTTVTNVGGDSTLVERNAPPVFLGAIMPTSCGGSIQAGASDRNGSGAFGLSWVGEECSLRMIGDRFQQLGMVDTACEVYRSTKAFQKAAKRNPKLASLDCSVKPAPATVPVLVAPELAPRIPRG